MFRVVQANLKSFEQITVTLYIFLEVSFKDHFDKKRVQREGESTESATTKEQLQ